MGRRWVTLAALAALAASTSQASDGGARLLAAGDIAECNGTGDTATAALLDKLDGTVAALGDNAYESGTAEEFADCYDPTWGRFKARTRPAAGNHDYGTVGAEGYYDYFGPTAGDPDRGYYSYDLGAWHIDVLNSNCDEVGGCGEDSAQAAWLAADLAAHPTRCALAYWHHPRFSSGKHGSDDTYDAFWRILRARDVEVILNGHDHDYERFAPQNPDGDADPNGIREFVVGTGGQKLREFKDPVANSETRQTGSFGILALALRSGSYAWQFIGVDGSVRDRGEADCH